MRPLHPLLFVLVVAGLLCAALAPVALGSWPGPAQQQDAGISPARSSATSAMASSPATSAPASGAGSAAGLRDPAADPGAFAKAVYDAFHARNWRLLGALLLVGLVWAARQAKRWVPWFGTDRGGAVLVLALGVLTGLSSALAAGAPFTGYLLLDCLTGSVIAAGGWVLVKRLIWPKDRATPAPAASPPGASSR